MKTKFKIALISSVIMLSLTGCKEEKGTTQGADVTTANVDVAKGSISALPLDTEIQKASYATGASFASLVKNILKGEGSELSPDYIISGFSETLKEQGKMSNEDINKILVDYGKKLEEQTKVKLDAARKTNVADGDKFRKEFAAQEGVITTDSGLMYKIENAGNDNHPGEYDTVVVHYSGKLVDGKEFDSSYARNQPATFPLNGVIHGWTEGLQLIGEGGKIKLVIPPELGYGDNNLPGIGDRPGIGPQSTLVFDVELIKIQNDDDEEEATEEESAQTDEDATEEQAANTAEEKQDATSTEKTANATQTQPANKPAK